MNMGHSFLSVGQSGHSCLPAGQMDHGFPSLNNSDNVDLAVRLHDRSYIPFVKFRPGFLTVSTDLRTNAFIFDMREHCSQPIRTTNLDPGFTTFGYSENANLFPNPCKSVESFFYHC